MPKLAIIGTIEVAPGLREKLLPLIMAHRARCLKDEPKITVQFDAKDDLSGTSPTWAVPVPSPAFMALPDKPPSEAT